MKSKRAKECADRYIATGVHKGVHRYKYVIQAIEFAEQDAEERAVRILEEFIAEGLLLTKEDEIVSKFKESLNGDQSDE